MKRTLEDFKRQAKADGAPITVDLRDDQHIRCLTLSNFQKDVGAEGRWDIKGWASTLSVDFYNEIVEPEAFRRFLPNFIEKFPVMLLNHEWRGMPIGKFTTAEIRPEYGLWVEGFVSKTADKVWTLIQEDILRAFSIGFIGKKIEISSDDRPDVWKEIELVEISIVNVPANRDALFSIAKSKGIDLSQFTRGVEIDAAPPVTRHTEDVQMDKEELAGIVTGALTKSLVTINEGAANAAEIRLDGRLKSMDTDLGSVKQSLVEMKTSYGNLVTKAEQEAFYKTWKEEFAGLESALKSHRSHQTLENVNPTSFSGAKRLSALLTERNMASELNMSQAHCRSLMHLPEHMYRKGSDQFELASKFQEASDELFILAALVQAKNPGGWNGIKSLWYYKEVYKPIHDDFRSSVKAMDTATAGEGAEWIPTGFSATLQEVAQATGDISDLFPTFTMPTNPYKWPIATSFPTIYYWPESTGDNSTSITASNRGTSNVTFTAKQFAGRVLTSGELTEDSIIPVLPDIRQSLAQALTRAREDSIMNGDTAATHQDTGITFASTDHRRAFLGLRALAIDLSATVDTGSYGTGGSTELRAIRALTGKYGIRPSEGAYIVSLRDAFYIMNDANVVSLEKFGPLATILRGELAVIDGMPIRASEFQRSDLNATGLFDNSTTTKSAATFVNRQAFKLAQRRMPTIEAEKIIETQQFQVVATSREDFQTMYGTDDVVALGYNTSA
jgi:HK97 family phage prohead protease/HK97 family phage major capsid protein